LPPGTPSTGADEVVRRSQLRAPGLAPRSQGALLTRTSRLIGGEGAPRLRSLARLVSLPAASAGRFGRTRGRAKTGTSRRGGQKRRLRRRCTTKHQDRYKPAQPTSFRGPGAHPGRGRPAGLDPLRTWNLHGAFALGGVEVDAARRVPPRRAASCRSRRRTRSQHGAGSHLRACAIAACPRRSAGSPLAVRASLRLPAHNLNGDQFVVFFFLWCLAARATTREYKVGSWQRPPSDNQGDVPPCPAITVPKRFRGRWGQRGGLRSTSHDSGRPARTFRSWNEELADGEGSPRDRRHGPLGDPGTAGTRAAPKGGGVPITVAVEPGVRPGRQRRRGRASFMRERRPGVVDYEGGATVVGARTPFSARRPPPSLSRGDSPNGTPATHGNGSAFSLEGTQTRPVCNSGGLI